MSVNAEMQRAIMRTWATGVTIVTTHHNGHDHGLTVSAFSSVSVEPPQVLVVIAKSSRTLEPLQASGIFAVNVLTHEQLPISNRFASRDTDAADRFERLDVLRSVTGAPIIKGCLAYLDCRVTGTLDADNNVIFLGQVVAGEVFGGQPLLYWDRNYRQLKSD